MSSVKPSFWSIFCGGRTTLYTWGYHYSWTGIPVLKQPELNGLMEGVELCSFKIYLILVCMYVHMYCSFSSLSLSFWIRLHICHICIYYVTENRLCTTHLNKHVSWKSKICVPPDAHEPIIDHLILAWLWGRWNSCWRSAAWMIPSPWGAFGGKHEKPY